MLYSVGVVQRTPCKRNPNTDDPRDGESKAQPGKHQLGKHSIQYLKDFLPPFLPFSFFPSFFFLSFLPFSVFFHPSPRDGGKQKHREGEGGRSPSPSLHLTPSFLPPFLSFLPPPPSIPFFFSILLSSRLTLYSLPFSFCRSFTQTASENRYKVKLHMFWTHLKCGVCGRHRNTSLQ